MEKKLSAWCKNAKIEMINRDLKTTTLAKDEPKLCQFDLERACLQCSGSQKDF